MTQHNFQKIIFVSISVFLFASCIEKPKDSDADGVIDSKDKCPNLYGKTKDGCPPERVINNVKFFLETSASMEGYMRGNAEFVKIIPNFLVDVENRINFKNKPIKINYISESISPYSKSTRDFIHDISTTSVAESKSSEMHKIFEMVTNNTDSNDISIFVSDCILSYRDNDIRVNPEINRQKADGELKAFIKDAFLKIKRKNVGASVYGFNSKFYGKYYNYQNGKIPLKGDVNRPFYVWVIGNKELLKKFNNQLFEIESFRPAMSMDFGIFENPISSYHLLFKTEKSGLWQSDRENLSEVEITRAKPCKFAVAVDLNSLPAYASNLQYLQKNIKILPSSGVCSLASVKPIKDIDLNRAAPKEKEFLQSSTHVFTFVVSEIYGSETSVNVTLPLRYDTSYVAWSIMDDRNISQISGKTFAFEHLINGIREAYQNNNENFINIIINLKKVN